MRIYNIYYMHMKKTKWEFNINLWVNLQTVTLLVLFYIVDYEKNVLLKHLWEEILKLYEVLKYWLYYTNMFIVYKIFLLFFFVFSCNTIWCFFFLICSLIRFICLLINCFDKIKKKEIIKIVNYFSIFNN